MSLFLRYFRYLIPSSPDNKRPNSFVNHQINYNVTRYQIVLGDSSPNSSVEITVGHLVSYRSSFCLYCNRGRFILLNYVSTTFWTVRFLSVIFLGFKSVLDFGDNGLLTSLFISITIVLDPSTVLAFCRSTERQPSTLYFFPG